MVTKVNKIQNKGKILKQSRFLHGAALGTLGFCTKWAVSPDGSDPEWMEVQEVALHLKSLPDRLKGRRIVHISDLHLSQLVSANYLKNCIARINQLNPDIVLMTGDYITHDFTGRYRTQAAQIIGALDAAHGVYACLGNHDYGAGVTIDSNRHNLADEITQSLTDNGVTVLRNESAPVDIDGHCLWLVGLGDLWVGDFNPNQAFINVPQREAVIALAHNPRAIHYLHSHNVGAVVSGHTHGVQMRWKVSGGISRKNRRFHAGMYDVNGKKLYVNRGLGRLGRARFNARPEITVLTLR